MPVKDIPFDYSLYGTGNSGKLWQSPTFMRSSRIVKPGGLYENAKPE
jgi:hypothetical protein